MSIEASYSHTAVAWGDGPLLGGSHSNMKNKFPVPHFRRNVGMVVPFLPTNELHPFTKSTENGYGSAVYSIALVELLQIAE